LDAAPGAAEMTTCTPVKPREPCKCTSTERCTSVPLPTGFYCRKRQEEAERYNDADFEAEELDEYESFDCHMGSDGFCGAAGSEDCELECPYRRCGHCGESLVDGKAVDAHFSDHGPVCQEPQ
jgi:hypothetical protein